MLFCPVVATLLNFQTLLWCQTFAYFVACLSCSVIKSSSPKAQPEIGFSIVLRDTSTVAVCGSKVELRLCIALISSLAIPTYRLSFIPRDTIAKIVGHAKPEFSLYIALIGGFAPPTWCLGFILSNS